MSPLSLADVVAASADLATTSSRTAKVARLALSIVEALRRLEYRGYDSSGIAVADAAVGRLLDVLEARHPAPARGVRGSPPWELCSGERRRPNTPTCAAS